MGSVRALPYAVCRKCKKQSHAIAGETVMIQPKLKPVTTEFDPPQPGLLDVDGVGLSGVGDAQRPDLEDEVALRGVVAIDIPREVIARFSGTLVLNKLPERQPEVLFDGGGQFRTGDDE
jgi:hypothetical protein